MDKQTLSQYGWVVIAVLVLSVMIALATPFGEFIADGFESTYTGFGDVNDNALGVFGQTTERPAEVKYYQPYRAEFDWGTVEYVFHKDGTVDIYQNEYGYIERGIVTPVGLAIYSEGSINLDGTIFQISDDGTVLNAEDQNGEKATFTLIPTTIKPMQMNTEYSYEWEDTDYNDYGKESIVFQENGSAVAISYYMGEEAQRDELPAGNFKYFNQYIEEHYYDEYDGQTYIDRYAIYPDGSKIILWNGVYEMSCMHQNTIIKNKADYYTGDKHCADCDELLEKGYWLDQETPALYDENGNVIKTWEQLLAEGSVTVEGTRLTKIDFDLQGYRLVIPASIKSCGGDTEANRYDKEAFVYAVMDYPEECGIKVIQFQNGTETIGTHTFAETTGITVYYPETVTKFESYAMCSVNGFVHYKGIVYDMNMDGDLWYETWDIFNELPEAEEQAMYVYK